MSRNFILKILNGTDTIIATYFEYSTVWKEISISENRIPNLNLQQAIHNLDSIIIAEDVERKYYRTGNKFD